MFFAPAPCLSLGLVEETREFAVSFVLHHDAVPRAALHNIAQLHADVRAVNWEQSSWFARQMGDRVSRQAIKLILSKSEQTTEQRSHPLLLERQHGQLLDDCTLPELTPLHTPGRVFLLHKLPGESQHFGGGGGGSGGAARAGAADSLDVGEFSLMAVPPDDVLDWGFVVSESMLTDHKGRSYLNAVHSVLGRQNSVLGAQVSASFELDGLVGGGCRS